MLSTLSRRQAERTALAILLLLIPVALVVVRGALGFGDAVCAYETFSAARRYVGPMSGFLVSLEAVPQCASPLYVVMLGIASSSDLSVPWMALLSGGTAWGLTALVVADFGRRLGHPIAGGLAALLIAVSPWALASEVVATHVLWALCFIWGAVWAAVAGRPLLHALLLCAALMLELHPLVLGVVGFLLIYSWRTSARLVWMTLGGLITPLVLWFVVIPAPRPVVFDIQFGLRETVERFLVLTHESEFYWLFPVFVAAGLGVAARAGRYGWMSAIFAWAGAVVVASPLALGLVVTLNACWAGLGIVAISRWAIAWRAPHIAPRRVFRVVGLLGISMLALLQVLSLAHRGQRYPSTTQALLAEAAGYVQRHAAPDDQVLSPTHVGYEIALPTLAYEGLQRDVAALSEVLVAAKQKPPVWCISLRSLGWDDLQRTGWFQNTYLAVETFSSSYVPGSPVTVWRQRPMKFDLGNYDPLDVRLPDGRFWVGSVYAPGRITPGDVISATLYVYEPDPLDDPQVATVYLRSMGEDTVVTPQDGPRATRLALDGLDLGRVWAYQFEIPTPGGLPVGAYKLSASLYDYDRDRFDQIYQGEAVFPANRVTLGYVVVPWLGDVSGVIPVGATLGDRATLVAYDVDAAPTTGTALPVTLYWEGMAAASEASDDHFVFVHLLDADGNLVTQHDGPPAEGRYPVVAWRPGDLVPDTHVLMLGPDLAPGAYKLQVGMYTWPTLTRLPAWDAAGEALPDGVVVLGEVVVR